MTKHGEPQKFLECNQSYNGDDCIIWPFSRDSSGYAQIWNTRSMKTVSKLLCIELNGLPPTPQHEAAHSCGKGSNGCVTKNHVYWATRSENEIEKIKHGTSNRGNQRSGKAKLTESQVHELRALYGTMGYTRLASKYGINRKSVEKIVKRINWAHI